MNEGLLLSILMAFCGLLFIVRLIAMKLRIDPMAKRYKPGTPEYAGVMRLTGQPRFTITIIITLLAVLLFLAYAVKDIQDLLKINISDAHGVLVNTIIGALIILSIVLILAYYLLVKPNILSHPEDKTSTKRDK